MDCKKELMNLLKEDWLDIAQQGECAVLDSGEYRTVETIEVGESRWQDHYEAITKAPDGKFYKWEYALGKTENQDHSGPNEYGDIKLTEVQRREKVVTTIEWVAVDSSQAQLF